jgi:hypothetical protein
LKRLNPTHRRPGPGLAMSVFAFITIALAGLLPIVSGASAAPGQGSPTWTPLQPDEPLAGHDAVLTPGGKLLLYGGESELGVAPTALRQLDLASPNGQWTSLGVQGDVPVARLPDRGLPGSRAVVDPGENLLLTVCDCRGGNTFILDLAGGRWNHAPGDADLPLWFSVLAYDAPRDRAVLYGGQQYGLGDQVAAKGWAYDLSPARKGWQALPDAPFEMVYQAADVDPKSGHVLVFGGLAAKGSVEASLWRLDLARADEPGAWQDITTLAGSGPSPRVGATLTVDPATSQALLYGGLAADGDLADVWMLDYADPTRPTWTQVEVPGPGPGSRSGHSAVWDPAGKRAVIYGGTDLDDLTGEASYLNDAWAFRIEEPEEPPRPTIFMPVSYNGISASDP